jgi:nitrite reductase/ring-hydroxylating ferredoxin subunit
MERRSFLKWALGGLGGALSLAGLGSLGLWLNGRRLRAGRGSFQRVARLGELSVDAPVKVLAQDLPPGTWALPPARPLGEVWLIRRGPESVDACSARCPHQGGKLQFNGKHFVCPSHGAEFDLSCRRLRGQRNPAPRDMDPLEVRLAPDPTGSDAAVQVRYEEFALNLKERKAVGPRP